MPESVFKKFERRAYPYRFEGSLHIGTVAGGTPSNAKTAEGWINTILRDKDAVIIDQVNQIMVERGVADMDEAIRELAEKNHLNGFKRDPERGGELYIEGRQLKAAIKEAVSVAAAAKKIPLKGWGETRKGVHGFVAEHICVEEDRLHLGVVEPSGVMQRFVHTYRGSGIQYEEYVSDAKVDFTVLADYPFTKSQWAMIWLTGEQQGIGASRSQGYGRYTVTRWEQVGGGDPGDSGDSE